MLPRQPLTPTVGCIRMHNEDAEELSNLMIEEGNQIPLHVTNTISIEDNKIIDSSQ